MLLGIHLTLKIGRTDAVPAPLLLTEALSGVEVMQNESGPSGFELTFQIGRSGPFNLPDYALLKNPLLRPFNRVAVIVRFNLLPTVLIDGFVTQIQLTPSEEPGKSVLTVTGEDVSVVMNLIETTCPYPGMSEVARVRAILAKYYRLGWTAGSVKVVPPIVPDSSLPTEEISIQNGTDYKYLTTLAAQHGYVFYVRPGALPNTNIPYWGPALPPDEMGRVALHSSLAVNMGPQTNVNSVNFTYDALATEMINGEVVEPDVNKPILVYFPPFSTDVPLAAVPGAIYQLWQTRVSRMDLKPPSIGKSATDEEREKARVSYGRSIPQAYERARSQVNDSANRTVTVSGELDALRYGGALQARTVVGLRGAGFTYDGLYFVKSVTHSIRRGEYKQRFTLRREGLGTLVPFVPP
jgi:hypothetical protein